MIYLLIVLGLLVLWAIYSYNRFITLRNRTDEAWADIEVQLKRRYDLIPNLVNTVKGYATHESTAFEKVTAARASAMGAKTMGEHGKGEAMLGQAITGLFGIAEAYPDLKANTNFLQLQEDLGSIEEKINQSRRYYNGTVREYNTDLAVFPKNIVAGLFGFSPETFFKEDEAAATAPKISFQ